MKAMVDIPFSAIEAYVEAVKKKKDICEIPPSARFILPTSDFIVFPGRKANEWNFDTLVCDQLGGKSTGTQAGRCKNCKK